ncbi:MAG: glutamyl-tRNA reductase [Pseudomonadota bacterium]|nr:glutamyl-tRNA reductase [Pseudomonadota bacterium]
MALLLVGINHTTASIDLREKVAFPPAIISEALSDLMALPAVAEAVIVSTCNRTEIYVDFTVDHTPNGELQFRPLIEWLSRYHDLNSGHLEQSCYFYEGIEVVRHLMRVSCGLDSMILGEPQILGQIKSAFAFSTDNDAVGAALGRAFQAAFSIAKEVRTETAIGESPVSVAYAAAVLADRIFSDLPSLTVLLIGAGRTIELVARHLVERGIRSLIVANRTLDNALDIADRFSAVGALLSEIPERLNDADIVVSSTNSQLPLLGKGAVERALKARKHKPMLLIDLAVPRDIEQEVGQVADAYLYSIDDISEVIEDSQKSREEAAEQAHSIIERGVEAFQKKLSSLNAVTTLKAFRDKADSIRTLELEKAHKAIQKGEETEAVVENLARSLTNKLIHTPSVQMKRASAEGRDEILELVRELFALDENE